MADTNDGNNEVHERNRAWKLEWDSHMESARIAEENGDEASRKRHMRHAERVKDNFFRANSGLAYAAARKHLSKQSQSNWEDYIQEAVVAMLKAFPDWDPDRGTFATFSRMYAEGLVRRAVASYERPGITYGDHTATPAARAAEAKLRESLGRSPTFEEIAEEAGISVGVARRALSVRPVSLDAPVGDSEGGTRMDLVADDAGDDGSDNPIGDAYEMREEDSQWLQAISEMEPQLAAVMIRRFGLDGAPDQAHAEIGELLDISREAARRAEISAIEKLRDDWGIEIALPAEEVSVEN